MSRRHRRQRAAPWRRAAVGIAGCLLLSCATLVAGGQSASVPALKAAFVYNFSNFVEWPTDSLAPDAVILFCIYGDDAVADALSETLRARMVGAHRAATRRVTPNGQLRGCHVLYASGLDTANASQLVTAARGLPIFTVSDFNGFAALGGVANLVVDGDRMRFGINVDAARRARLQLSSKLLAVAMIVKEPSLAGKD